MHWGNEIGTINILTITITTTTTLKGITTKVEATKATKNKLMEKAERNITSGINVNRRRSSSPISKSAKTESI